MNNDSMLYGVGGAIVGLLVGMFTGGSDEGDLEKKLMAALESQSAATLAAVDERVGGLDEQLGGLGARIDEVAAGLSAVTSGVEDIDSAFAAVADSQGAMGETVKAHVDDVVAALMGKMDDMAAASPAPAAAAAPAAEAEPAEEAAAPAAEPAPEGTPVGRTEVMLDGKARVFVSKINEEEGIVRVAINGLSLQMIGGWRKATFEVDGQACSLTLDAIDRGHAQMSATCG